MNPMEINLTNLKLRLTNVTQDREPEISALVRPKTEKLGFRREETAETVNENDCRSS